MAGFPSPFSAENPYIGAAADAGSAAAHLAGALRQAAVDQAAIKQQADEKAAAQAHQDASDLATALAVRGGILVDNDPGNKAQFGPNDKPTLGTMKGNEAQRPDYGAQANNPDYSFDPSRIVMTGGVPVYYPTPEEKAAVEAKNKGKLDDSNSFPLTATSAQAMNEAGYDAKAGQRWPLAHANVVTEAVKQHLGKSQLDDSNSVVITQDAADRLHAAGVDVKVGARWPLDKMNELKSLLEMTQPKPAAKTARTRVDLEHYNQPVSINEDTGEITPLKLPPGVKPQATPAQQESDERFRERQQDQQQRGRDAAQKTIDQLQTREQEQHGKRSAYASVLWSGPIDKQTGQPGETPDDATIVDPDDRKQHVMGPALRRYYMDRYQRATDLAGSYHDQQQKIIRQNGGDAKGAPADAAKAAPPAPAKTAQASAPPYAAAKSATAAAAPAKQGQTKTNKQPVTMQHVRNYAKQKGVSEAQAIREFQQYGYQIGQ